MKQFEIKGLGVEELSSQESQTVNGGNPFLLILIAVDIILAPMIYLMCKAAE